MKEITKEEVYNRFFNFCKEHPIGLPRTIVSEFNSLIIDELVYEKKIVKHNMGIGGIFYTLPDENGEPIYKKSW